ncbi:MAG TPA: hypothetical protein VHU91_00520 [Mycobacteriales bacterium]|jgi:hypothetical protein|nr:hypothetical protein [Mycobacteriales bacterium]
MSRHPDLPKGAWSNYKDLLSFKIKRGQTLRSEALNPGHVEYAAQVWDSFLKARKAAKKPGLHCR